MSRFPKLTETFVLDEVLEMERQGVTVLLFPLRRERAAVRHRSAEPIVARAHFTPWISPRIAVDNVTCLLRRPLRYLGTLFTILRTNWRSPRFLFGNLAYFPKTVSLAARMRRLGVQHVHAHFASFPAAAAFTVGRLANLSWSFTAHGSDLHRDQAMLTTKVAESAFAVTISQYNREFIAERVGETSASAVEVVRCGIRPENFAVAPAPSPGARLELICVGTLHAVKGQGHLLNAMARLQELGVAHRCHFVGDGPDRERLGELAAQMGLADAALFHGACRREEVAALLSAAHVAVAPSVPTADGRREGIPVALMEAAASGLALVASRLSGIPELVVDGVSGLLVEPGDDAALAEAVARYARDPELRDAMARGAREKVLQEYSLRRNVATLRELMGQVLGDGARTKAMASL